MPERQILFRTFGRIFTGLSDTSKAFLIILITGGLVCCTSDGLVQHKWFASSTPGGGARVCLVGHGPLCWSKVPEFGGPWASLLGALLPLGSAPRKRLLQLCTHSL